MNLLSIFFVVCTLSINIHASASLEPFKRFPLQEEVSALSFSGRYLVIGTKCGVLRIQGLEEHSGYCFQRSLIQGEIQNVRSFNGTGLLAEHEGGVVMMDLDHHGVLTQPLLIPNPLRQRVPGNETEDSVSFYHLLTGQPLLVALRRHRIFSVQHNTLHIGVFDGDSWHNNEILDVVAAAVHSNTERMAVCFNNGTISLWQTNVPSRLILEFQVPVMPAGLLNTVQFSPHGSVIAVHSEPFNLDADRVIHFYDTESGVLVRQLNLCRDGIHSFSFSPDNLHFAAITDTHVYLWNLITGRQVVSMMHSPIYTRGLVAFSPCGRILATAMGNAGVLLWKIRMQQDCDDDAVRVSFAEMGLQD